jgi:3-deoxy-D-arabino-heptulosonate 7-phosphate (DAHP) synthase
LRGGAFKPRTSPYAFKDWASWDSSCYAKPLTSMGCA